MIQTTNDDVGITVGYDQAFVLSLRSLPPLSFYYYLAYHMSNSNPSIRLLIQPSMRTANRSMISLMSPLYLLACKNIY